MASAICPLMGHTVVTDLEPGEAGFVDWGEARYHADRDHVSNSWLSVLIKEGPAIYRAKRDGLIDSDESDSMRFGTLVHLALIEPDEWRRRLFEPEPVRPANANGRGKKGTPEKDSYLRWKRDVDEWATELEQAPGAIVLTERERERVEACAESVRQHAADEPGELGASDLLAATTATEQTILRRDEETGILLRHRLDLLADMGVRVIADLKTTQDPSPDAFARSVARFGYHRQAAMYVDALQAVEPDAEIHFVIIAVRSRFPFEVATHVIEADELRQGRREYRRALQDLARRREQNDWRAAWQRGLNRLTLPRWAFDKDDDQ